MGCLKLTYDYQEQGEKNDSLKWSVWVNPESDFLGVVDQQTQGGGPGSDFIYDNNNKIGLHREAGQGQISFMTTIIKLA